MRSLALIVAAALSFLGAQSKSRLEVTAAIGNGTFARLWTAPAGGGTCYFLTVGRRRAARAPAVPKHCTRVDHLPPSAANRVAYTISGPDRTATGTIVYGEIEALSPVSRIAVLGPGASVPVIANGRWFVGALPSRDPSTHWRLVAYGRGGAILGRVYF